MINPFHVRVRHKNALSDRYVKMSLQLYQVDYKSYLLDFKSLSSEENDGSCVAGGDVGCGKCVNRCCAVLTASSDIGLIMSCNLWQFYYGDILFAKMN